jgi:hypothetical protein
VRPGLRKLVLTTHVATSVGWLGAVLAYLALALGAMTRGDAETIRATWLAMELIGWYGIVPLALASLLIGLVNALATPWGLFRHYWVVTKLLLTLFATLILLLHMPSVSDKAELARASEATAIGGLGGELFHAGGGLLILLLILTLSIYKPRGLTAHGWRKQQEQRSVQD